MKRIQLKTLGVVAIATTLFLVAASFQSAPGPTKRSIRDTVPEKKIRNIEEAMEALEKGRIEMEASMKDVDLAKIEKEIAEAMKVMKIDLEKMHIDLEKAMKELDEAKIEANMEKAMKEIDAAKLSELKELEKVDWEKMKAEIKASMAKIDTEKIRADIEKARKIELKELNEELKNIKPQIEKSMQEARVSMEKAKREMTEYKGFIDDLHGAGLINKEKDYSIVYKDGELTVNGKKQPADLVSKYPFLKEKKDFTISRTNDRFNIDN